MRNQRMNKAIGTPGVAPAIDEPNGVFKLLTAGAFVAVLSVAGLAACSDSTAEDPLPLTESDSGVVEETPPDDAPVEEAPVEEAPVEEAPTEDDSMEDDSMEEGG